MQIPEAEKRGLTGDYGDVIVGAAIRLLKTEANPARYHPVNGRNRRLNTPDNHFRAREKALAGCVQAIIQCRKGFDGVPKSGD